MSNLTVQQKQNLSTGIKDVLTGLDISLKIQEMIGRKPDSYITSVMQAIESNDLLLQCTPQSITGAVLTSCSMNLPLNNNLGLAYLVPFSGSVQLQIGYKGFIQLAQRTGQIKSINAIAVYDTDTEESALKRLTSILPQKVSGNIIGYVARLETITGFEAHVSMTNEELEQHAEKYSQTYKAAKSKKQNWSVWHKNFDAMAKKTVIKALMKYCPLSVELQTAIQSDQGVINSEGDIGYPDNEIRDVTPARKLNNEEFERMVNAVKSKNLEKKDALNESVYALSEFQYETINAIEV